MAQKHRRLIFYLIAGTVIIFIGFFLFQYIFVWSYQNFLEQEKISEPQFEKLNLVVLDSFPPPPGVGEVERSSGLRSQYGRFFHGVVLKIQYDNQQKNIDQVVQYYEDRLEKQHWIQKEKTPNLWYYFQKSCFRLDYHLHGEYGYTVEIWQDYLSQPFSPKMPFSIHPGLILGFHELFETVVDQCP